MQRARLSDDGIPRNTEVLGMFAALLLLLLFPTLGLAQIHNIVVDSPGDAGKYSSLAVDSQNCSHVSYYDATRHVLKYARIDNLGLSIEDVDRLASVGSYSAIMVDATNAPHISYYDATHKDLKYAVKRGTAWTVQTVDSTGNVGMYSSITVDQLNNPWISYYDGNKYLKLAYMEAGSWQIKQCCQVELNDGISAGGRSTAIQLEHLGSNPMILFFDFASATLKFALYDRTLNEWHTENIRNASSTLQDLSFALDAANQPHLAFSEVSPTGAESVQYAKKTCLGSGCLTQVTPAQPTGEGTWTFEQVDAATGDSTSLALDATQNLPWVTYYDLSYGLRLARKNGTTWSVQTVDPGWGVGPYNSIALDHANNPHISYYDSVLADLKYASTSVPPPINAWIKDCPADNGSVPSTPNCPDWRSSPDIWFDKYGNGLPGKPGLPGVSPPGVRTTLKARVRNRGFATAENISVKFFVSGPKLPDFPLPAGIDRLATLIGENTVTVATNSAVTTSINWTPPTWIGTRNWCVGVVLNHPADHAVSPVVLPPMDDNLAVHCFLLSHP